MSGSSSTAPQTWVDILKPIQTGVVMLLTGAGGLILANGFVFPTTWQDAVKFAFAAAAGGGLLHVTAPRDQTK
jgi:hypothetical protein